MDANTIIQIISSLGFRQRVSHKFSNGCVFVPYLLLVQLVNVIFPFHLSKI